MQNEERIAQKLDDDFIFSTCCHIRFPIYAEGTSSNRSEIEETRDLSVKEESREHWRNRLNPSFEEGRKTPFCSRHSSKALDDEVDIERFTAMEQVRDLSQHSMGEQWGGYNYGSSSVTEPMAVNDDYSEYYGRVPTDAQSKREQKRRPKPKDGTQLVCRVCGDKALGYNFDAITCESCKAFFRRNAQKTKVFTCSFDGNCKLDTHTRKFCSGCRLKKCFEVGMKKDWILSEEQLAKRRQKGPKPNGNNGTKQRRLDDPNEPFDQPISSSEVMSSSEISTNYQSDPSDDSTRSPVDNFSPFKNEIDDDDFPRPLREDYRTEIENLEFQYSSVFDTPYNEDQYNKLTNNPRTPNELFNLTDIFIRRLIKFAKHVPEFKDLQQEDQIHLLKGGIMEIMVLRSAMGFDSQGMGWKVRTATQNCVKETKLSPEMIKALDSGMYMEHVRFVMSLNELTRTNKTILTLLFVIELFSSDRPCLKNKELVSKGQEKFSMWLRAYLESIYPISEARQLYPKLLMKLLDVRSLGESSAQLASHLDITRLEPLLVEIFSLQK